jgi:hypothetical protein
MKLTLSVDTGDGAYQVVTSLKNMVAWERKFKRKASELATGVGMEDLAFLAFEATKNAGIVCSPVFDDFIDSIVTLDVVEEEPTVNP